MYLAAFSDSEQSSNAEAGLSDCLTQGLPLVWDASSAGAPHSGRCSLLWAPRLRGDGGGLQALHRGGGAAPIERHALIGRPDLGDNALCRSPALGAMVVGCRRCIAAGAPLPQNAVPNSEYMTWETTLFVGAPPPGRWWWSAGTASRRGRRSHKKPLTEHSSHTRTPQSLWAGQANKSGCLFRNRPTASR
jgi:hypothetical protein